MSSNIIMLHSLMNILCTAFAVFIKHTQQEIALNAAFLCAAGGTWLFGVKLGWLVVGAYVGMALDECIRAVFMYLRWRRGCWRTKKLVSPGK